MLRRFTAVAAAAAAFQGCHGFSSTTTPRRAFAANFRSYYDRLAPGAQTNSTVQFSFVPPSSASINATSEYEDFGSKPVALYLPGMDGFGISAAQWQFDDLAESFELWRMAVSLDDRSSFADLVRVVTNFIDNLPNGSDNLSSAPVYIIGESFGGLLASSVAIKLQKRHEQTKKQNKNPVVGLVLVNPATSFDRSIWDRLAPALTALPHDGGRASLFGLPSPYAVLGSITLGSLTLGSRQNNRVIDIIRDNLPSPTNPRDVAAFFGEFTDLFKLTAEKLPPEIVTHRINEWLMAGSAAVNARGQLDLLQVPTKVIVGDQDRVLDSTREAKRLTELLANCETLTVRGAGHFVLDERVNLTEAIWYSELLDPSKHTHNNKNKKKTTYDPVLDWVLPPPDEVDKAYKAVVQPLKTAFSPVFFSTDAHGTRVRGLRGIPKVSDNPLLFVSNHQLLGVDLNLVVGELLKDGIVVRGLAHPIVFQGPGRDELGGRIPGLAPVDTENQPGFGNGIGGTSNFQKFGALPVTPRNYYRVLASGQNALLFPGGVREVFHGREESYKLFWPDEVDFVRTAARFNATIVPLSCVGMADSAIRVLDTQDMINLPGPLGTSARKFAENVTAARFNQANADEVFLPPIVAPGLPSRNYFLFGKPVSTIDLDPKDKDACLQVYRQVQRATQKGLDDLLDARKRDNFQSAPPRLFYERLTGAQAPTIDASTLNR